MRLATSEQSFAATRAIGDARISSDFQGTSCLLLPWLLTHHLTRVTQATYSGIPVYELYVQQTILMRVSMVSLLMQDV